MKNLLNKAKRKLEEIVFIEKSLEKFSESEYEKEKNISQKSLLITFGISATSLFFVFIGCINSWFKSVEVGYMFLFAFFIISFVCSIPTLFLLLGDLFYLKKNKSSANVVKANIFNKMKNTTLSLKQLEELKPFMNEIKNKTGKKELARALLKVEKETGEKFGNAGNFLYLFENYESIINKIKEENEKEELLEKQISSLYDKNKADKYENKNIMAL